MGLIKGVSDTRALKFLLSQMHYTNDGSGATGTYGYSMDFTVKASSKEMAIRKLMEAKGDMWEACEMPERRAWKRKKRKP